MAKTSMVVKSARRRRANLHRLALGLELKPKEGVRDYNRCQIVTCGRPRGYMGKFKMCRICFRMEARKGAIPGVRKSSW